MAIETKRVRRRELHFETVDQILDEAERLGKGNVRALGNWSPGQIFKHLAIVFDGSIDGLDVSAPWLVRRIAPLFKRRFLNRPMKPGFKLPTRAETVLFPSAAITTAQGLQALRDAISRQRSIAERKPSPVLGDMTRDEWNRLHCRHAELHLGFLTTEPAESHSD